MEWLVLVVVALILCFGFVLLYGAPYLPTLTPQVEAALELVNLKPGQTLLELGCGDGKMLIAAAQTGLHVVGYELNPLLALLAWARTRRFKGQVRVVWGNFWSQQWPEAAGIFTFLHPRFMKRLDTKITQLPSKNVKLVSFAFKIPEKEIARTKNGVFLYQY
jgi:16S rRNA A1518/A1519 N6-dimethyltransferase RsmA/KsgA/DIM1 with predicted DNA glycosylase/AP lyase activity